MEDTYTKLSELCCTGLTLTEELDQIQVKKNKFYNTRYIVELSVVDREEYEQLLTRDDTLLTLNKLCHNMSVKSYILILYRSMMINSIYDDNFFISWVTFEGKMGAVTERASDGSWPLTPT